MANGKVGAPVGNTNSAKGKPFLEALRRILAQETLTLPERKRRLHLIAEQLINQAARGEEWAIKELANRLDGKAIQGVAMVNPDGTSAPSLISPATLRGLEPAEADQLRALLVKAGAAISADDGSTE